MSQLYRKLSKYTNSVQNTLERIKLSKLYKKISKIFHKNLKCIKNTPK